MGLFTFHLPLKLIFLGVSCSGSGVAISSLISALIERNKENLIFKTLEEEVKEEKTMNGEYVLFNESGNKLCGTGKEGTTLFTDNTDCSRSGMKQYERKTRETSKLFLRSKEKNSLFGGEDQFLVKLWGRKIKRFERPKCNLVKSYSSLGTEGREGSCIK